MSRRNLSAAVFAVGACLAWGGSNLHGQTAAPQAAVRGRVAPAATVPAVGVSVGVADPLTLPGMESSAGVSVPGVPGVESESVAAIPLPPSVYPGMVGLATAALAGWRYRRRRRR
jgi:hypothetical protein